MNKPKRPPRPPTADRMLNQARWYLDRYAGTEAALRRFLTRRLTLAAQHHPDTDVDLAKVWLEAAIDRMRELGFVDDARWAESRARTLRRRGASGAAVRSALRQKGVDAELVDATLADDETPEPDLEAARTFARRSRIGPWRKAPVDADGRRRELARLARKGFQYEIARRVVDAAE
jgi:regulatory protein